MAQNTVRPKCFHTITNNDTTQLHKVHKLYSTHRDYTPQSCEQQVTPSSECWRSEVVLQVTTNERFKI